MDKKKLDRWADLLLDTGKRNNLIHFKDTKSSTVEVLLPAADVLFDKFQGTTTFEVFDPKLRQDDDLEEIDSPQRAEAQTPDTEAAADGRAAFLAQYADRIKRQNQLLLYSLSVDPLSAVKKIDKKAREFMEETGVTVSYMAFGFIHWKESGTSDSTFRAPLLLAPVRLSQNSAVDPYYIQSTEDDILVNPTFAYKLETEYGIKLPEYTDEGLREYLAKVRTLVSKLDWAVTDECKLGIFSFLKINMYRDLKDNADTILANGNVRQLLGEPVCADSSSEAADSTVPVFDPLLNLHSVVDADSSQIEAIEMAKSGQSFVLQGPPGTGKSQTITNIIAECLSDGKKVLFVSEKLAALRVVYEKLTRAGLSEFCLELHSHKANKKNVIADICHTLRSGRSTVSAKADAEIATKERAIRQLDAYAQELHTHRPVIETSLYGLYCAYAALRSAPDVEWPVPQLPEKGEAYLTEATSLLDQYVQYIASVGYDYRKNAWYGYIEPDTTYQTKSELKAELTETIDLLAQLLPLTQEISRQYAVSCTGLEDAHNWQSFFTLAANSNCITPALLCKETFLSVQNAAANLQTLAADILAARSVLDPIFDEDIYKLDGTEYHKKLTRQFTGCFSRLFASEYRTLLAQLRLCKKDGKKLSYSQAVQLTERLAQYQQTLADFRAYEEPVKPCLGPAYNGPYTDWAYVSEQLSALGRLHASSVCFGRLTECADWCSEQASFSSYAQRLLAVFQSCDEATVQRLADRFDRSLFDLTANSCTLSHARLQDCLDQLDRLDNWCHFRQLLSKLNAQQLLPYITAAISAKLEPETIVPAFRKLFFYQWIDRLLTQSPVLASFDRISQDKRIQTFTEKDVEQFEINKAKIRATLSSMRPSLDMIAQGSALATLLREGEKKRKQKSIRTLLAETGELVQRVKPCFLMSPLSVSTYLAPSAVHFDVVIFDEASQIFPQDAIGAIYRAKQLIVVGDSMQMPPSNFFNTSLDIDTEDEESGDVTDFESILDLCTASMQQLRLCWHYRSRYEQLITFSNKNFYDRALVTFPSSAADGPGVGVDYFHVDGIFDRKSHTNRAEAEFIVDLVYENITKFPNRSLGVVAFSVAQQDLIDKLLSRRRQSRPDAEFIFRQDSDEPFFIKNLETVQGDERDTIIFSVAYGMDGQGRLLHNFGPLNRAGGERRLNVAVTRAKCNVQLVSSMHYTDIDLKRTSAEGARLLREYLDFAENGSIALERSVHTNVYEQFDSDFELEVCEYLRSKGFTVDTQVGCSGFRIDLALKRPNSSDYVLAIECDGATYHSSKNARDRDRLRQEILERMGWRFYRIWSTDWFRNKAVEQERLLAAVTAALDQLPRTAAPEPAPEPPSVTFEEVAEERHLEFPPYRAADLQAIFQKHPFADMREMVKKVLEVEAPLSEELLLHRIVWYFDREKVTSTVQRDFEQRMRYYQRFSIVRRNGFLYLADQTAFTFRGPGDITRDIKHIAPEELAAGMLEILKQNITADRNGLYRSLAAQCGLARVGKSINESMDAALALLHDSVTVDGELISLK